MPHLIASPVLISLLLLAASAGCAPSRLRLPTGPGVPFPDYAPVLTEAMSTCSRVRTLEFLLTLSGEAGGTRLRGRVRAALAPELARLEGLAPFGQPVFVLVSTAGETTLWLTREGRVVREAAAPEVLEALVGIALDADDLRAVVTGCLVAEPRPVGARRYEDDWIAVDLEEGATVYVRTIEGTPRVVAGVRGDLRVEYAEHVGGLPRRIRVTTAPAAGRREPVTDLAAGLSQLNVNVDLAPAVFTVKVPDDVLPMSLEELRAGGPLRETTTKE